MVCLLTIIYAFNMLSSYLSVQGHQTLANGIYPRVTFTIDLNPYTIDLNLYTIDLNPHTIDLNPCIELSLGHGKYILWLSSSDDFKSNAIGEENGQKNMNTMAIHAYMYVTTVTSTKQ